MERLRGANEDRAIPEGGPNGCVEIVKSEAIESPIMINITLGEIHFISIRLWARIYFDCNEWVAFFKRVQEKEEGVFFFFFFFLYVIHYLYVAVKDRRILL